MLSLNSKSDIDALIEHSSIRLVLIFKHSSSCPLSAYAFHQLMNYLKMDSSHIICGMVIVQRAREVSNEIAKRLNVRHESPQVILVDMGTAVWHCSHNRITSEILNETMQLYG